MISPSDLPWWGWLLCSFGAWIVCAIFFVINDESETAYGGCLSAFTFCITGLAGIITGTMALILFVKWVWTS